jgi:hypothetical protein
VISGKSEKNTISVLEIGKNTEKSRNTGYLTLVYTLLLLKSQKIEKKGFTVRITSLRAKFACKRPISEEQDKNRRKNRK